MFNLEFAYFPGDRVINLKPHYIDSKLIPLNAQGKVVRSSEDFKVVTVTWFGETFVEPVTTTVEAGDLTPVFNPPLI